MGRSVGMGVGVKVVVGVKVGVNDGVFTTIVVVGDKVVVNEELVAALIETGAETPQATIIATTGIIKINFRIRFIPTSIKRKTYTLRNTSIVKSSAAGIIFYAHPILFADHQAGCAHCSKYFFPKSQWSDQPVNILPQISYQEQIALVLPASSV